MDSILILQILSCYVSLSLALPASSCQNLADLSPRIQAEIDPNLCEKSTEFCGQSLVIKYCKKSCQLCDSEDETETKTPDLHQEVEAQDELEILKNTLEDSLKTSGGQSEIKNALSDKNRKFDKYWIQNGELRNIPEKLERLREWDQEMAKNRASFWGQIRYVTGAIWRGFKKFASHILAFLGFKHVTLETNQEVYEDFLEIQTSQEEEEERLNSEFEDENDNIISAHISNSLRVLVILSSVVGIYFIFLYLVKTRSLKIRSFKSVFQKNKASSVSSQKRKKRRK